MSRRASISRHGHGCGAMSCRLDVLLLLLCWLLLTSLYYNIPTARSRQHPFNKIYWFLAWIFCFDTEQAIWPAMCLAAASPPSTDFLLFMHASRLGCIQLWNGCWQAKQGVKEKWCGWNDVGGMCVWDLQVRLGRKRERNTSSTACAERARIHTRKGEGEEQRAQTHTNLLHAVDLPHSLAVHQPATGSRY